jgi:hypothetical protein
VHNFNTLQKQRAINAQPLNRQPPMKTNHQNNNDAVTRLRRAIANNEFEAYLMGENDYRFNDRLIETPTDLTRIFIGGLNEYVKETDKNKETVKQLFHDASITMLKKPIGTWWTIFILYEYLFAYKKNSLLFDIDVDPIIPHINTSLKASKDTLRNSKEWVGWRFTNGLWDNVVYMAEKINERLKGDKIKLDD